MKNKVDGITLLQMIKEGKIKDDTNIREYYLGIPTKHILTYHDGEIVWKPGDFMVGNLYKSEYDFEIIEDTPKEIELLNICKTGVNNYAVQDERGILCALTKSAKMIAENQNEIAKAVNYLLKKDKEGE